MWHQGSVPRIPRYQCGVPGCALAAARFSAAARRLAPRITPASISAPSRPPTIPGSGGEGACDHPKGLLNHRACIDGGDCTDGDPLGGRISVHHNLFAHNTHRNPRTTSGGTEVVNNVVYNWKYWIGSSTRGAS